MCVNVCACVFTCVYKYIFKGFHLFCEKGLPPPPQIILPSSSFPASHFPSPSLVANFPPLKKTSEGTALLVLFHARSSGPLVPFQMVAVAWANGSRILSTSQSETS